METCDWTPFIKAAVERSPVSLAIVEPMSVDEVYVWLKKMDGVSIYEGKRLAYPDEVANYKTGDGLEKAFLLANVIRRRNPQQDIEIIADDSNVVLKISNTVQNNILFFRLRSTCHKLLVPQKNNFRNHCAKLTWTRNPAVKDLHHRVDLDIMVSNKLGGTVEQDSFSNNRQKIGYWKG